MTTALISQSIIDQYNALDSAIRSLENMSAIGLRACHPSTPFDIYLREYKTIIAGSGRQNGKTHWIASHARKGDLIFCLDSLNTFEKVFFDLGIDLNDLPSVVTFHQQDQAYNQTEPIKRVFVDDAYYVFSRINRNKFYRNLMHRCTKETMFYLIG